MPTITPPSRAERLARGLGYAIVGFCGPWVMLFGPRDALLGPTFDYWWLSALWALFMTSGLFAGAAAVLGRFRGEYVMLPFLIAAVAIADVNLWIRASSEPEIYTRAFIVAGLVLVYAARFITLRRLVRLGSVLQERGRFWLGGLHPWTGTK